MAPNLTLTVNGEAIHLQSPAAGLSIGGLLEHLGIGGPVAVEVNRTIVKRAEHPTHRLADGDVVELVHFVGGG